MSKVEFAYFDLGNVVFTFKGGLEEIATRYERPYIDVEAVFLQYDDEICRGHMTPQELWGKYQSELNLGNESLNFAEFWTSHFAPIRETLGLLSILEAHKFPIGIISNIYPGIFELITQKGVIPPIDWKSKVLSCEIGSVKPEENIYKVAEQNIETPSNKILLIDDKTDFLTPAKQRGWQILQFDPTNPGKSVSEIQSLIGISI